jgi:beta-N-acetylhexosaminidase
MQENLVGRREVLLGGAGVSLGASGVWRLAPARHVQLSARLSARQLAGQRVIFSYPGLTPPSGLLQQISAGEAAGVIFFGENISSEAQIASVIKQLNAANARSPVRAPLLLMTDQEGGLVRRLPGAPVPSEKQIGESADPAAQAAQAGTGAGRNLAGVGMNVNLAPVLDVFRQAGNFIDRFQRSYSMNPRIVAECGRAFIAAQQRTGVAATAKHFPGLGAAAASQNTDLGPVTLGLSLSALRGVDERPYPPAIAARVKLIMASWAVYPALDARRPAGLSPVVIQRELRGRLGFRGVTITDALEAGALSSYGGNAHRAVLAAHAGMDLMLASARDVSQGQAVVAGLAAALRNGTLGAAGFNAAVKRATALRHSLR